MESEQNVKPGDWISIRSTDCVVAIVRDADDGQVVCEVVFNQDKPTNLDARWNGETWEFVESGDYGGYADKYPRLNEYVRILKNGR